MTHSYTAIAILSSIFSSIAWIFQGMAVHELSPLVVAAAQGLLSGAIFFSFSRLSGRSVSRALIQQNLKSLLALTVLRQVIVGTLLNFAQLYSSSIKIIFFTKLEPYFVLFWAWLLAGERISRQHFLLLMIHVSGAVLLSTGADLHLGQAQFGDLLVVAGLTISSFSYIRAKKLSQDLGAATVNGVTGFLGGTILLPFAIATAPSTAWSLSSPGWGHLLTLVILFNIFGLTMWYYALGHLDSWLVSALRAVGPLAAAPVAWFFFGQTLSTMQIFGGFLVLITSAALARGRAT
ncbi:MAG: DMT family transporter [Oligoflexia bacterium]|nr:DMT family transporter [Oligoflexia bacterium]